MRVVAQPVQVQVVQGQPAAFTWNARRYRVHAVLDVWRAAGRWWRREAPRDYWLLDAAPLTAELYRTRTPGGDTWVLARLAD